MIVDKWWREGTIRGKFGDKRLSIVKSGDTSPSDHDGVRGIVM
jgi:hypothetical protein